MLSAALLARIPPRALQAAQAISRGHFSDLADGFRAAFLTEVGRRAGKTFVPAGVSFAAARDAQFERLADLLEAHLDLAALDALIEGAAA